MGMAPHRTRIATLAATLLTLSLTSSLAHGATPAGAERVSDEHSLSFWVNPNDRGPIYSSPRKGASKVARLKLQTEDRLPNNYLVLRRFDDEDTHLTWYQLRIPQRPNGKKGWVREDSVGPLQRVTTALVVNRRTLRATLYRKGRKVFQAPVGVGKASTPTPSGRFWIREKLVLGGGHGVYGPIAFGTSAYSNQLTDWPKGGVVGIHGTNQPQLIPGRPSHGCIRMRNGDILRLARLMPVGTPLRIL
jgi:hypothetical protein